MKELIDALRNTNTKANKKKLKSVSDDELAEGLESLLKKKLSIVSVLEEMLALDKITKQWFPIAEPFLKGGDTPDMFDLMEIHQVLLSGIEKRKNIINLLNEIGGKEKFIEDMSYMVEAEEKFLEYIKDHI